MPTPPIKGCPRLQLLLHFQAGQQVAPDVQHDIGAGTYVVMDRMSEKQHDVQSHVQNYVGDGALDLSLERRRRNALLPPGIPPSVASPPLLRAEATVSG